MTYMDLVIYLLPHQDDETFIIPKIRNDTKSGKMQLFIFLTRNRSDDIWQRRQMESSYFLNLIGVKLPQILDIGNQVEVFDGELYRKITKVTKAIKAKIDSYKEIRSIEILSPAFEGGHQDHDAAFIISQNIQKQVSANILEYFMYNGYGTSGKIYKVVAPYKVREKHSLPFSFLDRYYLSLVIFIYRSQFKSMLGLWPFMLVKSFIFPLILRKNNFDFLADDKDMGIPLYERWGRVSRDEFIKEIQKEHNESE